MTVLPRSLAPPPHAIDSPSVLTRVLAAPDTGFTRWLVKWRWLFFIGLAILTVLPFNGQWRIGLDSSIYRGVADNLAAGHGYTFPVGRRQTQVYPGLPYLLAGLQAVFGKSLVPPLLLMNALALATLAGVYLLIKRHYPLWIAVVVTCGVGMNARFLIQAQEIMTDTPFLCAVVWAMLAWDWLGTATGWRRLAGLSAVMVVFLFVAATMRPTFWVLAAAWGLAAVWNAVRKRDRRSLIAVGVLGLVLLAFLVVDPRGRGLSLVQGAYEKQLLVILPDLADRVWANGATLFPKEIPEAFFNESLFGTGTLFATLLLIGAIIVTLRQPLWGLQILILTAIMLVISDVPRYYLMVLPALWLGYVLVLLALTAWARPMVRDGVLFVMFSLANFQNLGGALRLTTEQHAKDFVHEYKHGAYLPAIEMAKRLAGEPGPDHQKLSLGPDDVVIGPGAQVLAYLSQQQVLNGRLLGFDSQKPSRYADLLLAAATPKPPGRLYVIGPLAEYEKKDADLFKLLQHGLIVPGNLVAKVSVPARKEMPASNMWLAEARTVPPDRDWRQLPKVEKFVPIDPNKKPRLTPQQQENKRIKAERAERAARIEHKKLKAQRAERAAYLERKARKLRKQKKAATQPATQVGLGDWGLGLGEQALRALVFPQGPVPGPQSPLTIGKPPVGV